MKRIRKYLDDLEIPDEEEEEELRHACPVTDIPIIRWLLNERKETIRMDHRSSWFVPSWLYKPKLQFNTDTCLQCGSTYDDPVYNPKRPNTGTLEKVRVCDVG